jgi:hypothetical protein
MTLVAPPIDRQLRQLQRDQREKAQQAFHKAQAEMLEVAFRAEIAITNVVATRLGRDTRQIIRLRDQALPQLSIPARLRLLREIMDEESWSDDFPFVVPVFERLFAIRNTLAHSLTASLEEQDGGDWSFTRWSVRRVETFSISKLTYISKAAERAILSLNFIWVRSMPESFWLDES